MSKYKTLLFDMDGTVADTDEMIKAAMYILYDLYRDGVKTPDEEIVYFSGPPIRDTLKKEFPHMDQQFMFDEFHRVSETLYATHTFRYPHSREVLLELKEKGYNLGIVTNKLHNLTEYCLQCIGLDDIFDLIIGFNDVSKPKPNGEGILKSIAYFNSTKEETIYIGDNKVDLESANLAGVDCALVGWGPRFLPPEVKPTFKFNSYIDLKEKIYGKDF